MEVLCIKKGLCTSVFAWEDDEGLEVEVERWRVVVEDTLMERTECKKIDEEKTVGFIVFVVLFVTVAESTSRSLKVKESFVLAVRLCNQTFW